jgi:ATP-binding cassette subfamily F protein uup
MLEEALLCFQGTVILVSHDRWFLNRVCTHTLAFEPGGVTALYSGNYDYYLEKRRPPSTLIEPAAVAPKPAPARREKARKLSYKETRELESIESDIRAAEEKVATMEAAFADPAFFAKHGHKWEELEAELETAKKRVPQLYARWEELERVKAGAA